MDAADRSRLLRSLFLLGPLASLVLFGLGAWFLEATTAGKEIYAFLSNASTVPGGAIVYPNLTFAAFGWVLLTLGCSAGTCLRAFRKQGKKGRALAIYMLVATPVLAVAHIAVSAGIVGAGCAVVLSQS